jgi:hypothetical protein
VLLLLLMLLLLHTQVLLLTHTRHHVCAVAVCSHVCVHFATQLVGGSISVISLQDNQYIRHL